MFELNVLAALIAVLLIFSLTLKIRKKRLGGHMKHHGFLNVSSKGEVEIALVFRPTRVRVAFTDEVTCPLPSCAPEVPDQVEIEIIKIPGSKGGVRIKWQVNQERRVRWDAKGYSL